jgi:segregation and condensation protein B
MNGELKSILESLLFVMDEPLSIERIKAVVPQAETKEIRSALRDLGDEYDARKGGFYLREVAGGFQIRTRPEYTEYVKKILQPSPARLGRAALETLAIIAYKQPIMRSEIEHIRGVDSGGVVRTLMERKLIRVLGRKEIPGRPLIYATTRQFLEVFELRDLRDLPSPKEIEALGKADREQAEAPEEATGEPFPETGNNA